MMIQPHICNECMENNHEKCTGKSVLSKMFGEKCECYICKEY